MSKRTETLSRLSTAKLRRLLKEIKRTRGTLSEDAVDVAHANLVYAELTRRRRARGV